MREIRTTRGIQHALTAWRETPVALLLMLLLLLLLGLAVNPSFAALNPADAALIAAAARGDTASVERLLKQGASLKARDDTGRTAPPPAWCQPAPKLALPPPCPVSWAR